MHIAIVTAGGAGMFCGSCMHDNTWARALASQGAEVTLIPAYTPIRVDEDDLSRHPIFFGGINVYLEHRLPFWRKIPRALTRPLDAPWVINLATRFAVSSDAKRLGSLTVAMLNGESGPHRREVAELVDFLTRQITPDAICFSNALLVGSLRSLRQIFSGPIYCVLQGDDIFLEQLAEPHRSQSLALIEQRARDFDGFLVHSAYYRDFMSDYLNLPIERFHLIPLGIDVQGHAPQPPAAVNSSSKDDSTFTVGYFARVCHEKGLHRLVEAFRLLHSEFPNTRLRAGGYLGKADRAYFRAIERSARDLGDSFEYIGSPTDRAAKVAFLQSLDVLSVPTVYREPKGLYVLEAMANGIPVVQPRHGAFPEMIAATGGGLLVDPDDSHALARGLKELLLDPQRRLALGAAGHAAVRARFDLATMARASLDVFEQGLIASPTA